MSTTAEDAAIGRVVWVEPQRPRHRGPVFVGWDAGQCYPALRSDITRSSVAHEVVFGVGPGTWRGDHHGLVPVIVVDDPPSSWPSLDGALPYTLHRVRPVPPAPRRGTP